jgi:salicylate hydroxylase
LAGISDWHPNLRELINAVEQGPRWGLFSLPPLPTWSRGAVAVLGDAAHSMLPNHGQGANQAIEDATVIADILSRDDHVSIEAALSEYESRRRDRATRVQRSSWNLLDTFHLPDGPQADQRNAVLADELPERLEWLHGYDVTHALRS